MYCILRNVKNTFLPEEQKKRKSFKMFKVTNKNEKKIK